MVESQQSQPYYILIPQPDRDILDTKPTQGYGKLRPTQLVKYAGNWYGPRKKVDIYLLKKRYEERERKVYHVLDSFHPQIENYEDDLNASSEAYFDLQKKPKIISERFYIMWEILMFNDLLKNKKKTNIICLAEAPGSFLQSLLLYRERIVGSNDSYYCLSLHRENHEIPAFEKEFTDHYKKRIMIHPTCCLEDTKKKSNKKDTGDLKTMETIENFTKMIKKKTAFAELITADGTSLGVNNEVSQPDMSYQEQESFLLFMGQFLTAIMCQQEDGTFIMKIFESQCSITVKMIMMMYSFYESIEIYKPLSSSKVDSERFLICKKFIYPPGDKELMQKVDIVMTLFQKIKKRDKSKSFLVDMFMDYKMDDKIVNTIMYSNNFLMNESYHYINKMMSYVEANNFFGDEYNQYRNLQIKSTDYWLKRYYPIGSKNIQAVKNELSKEKETLNEETKKSVLHISQFIDN